MSDQPAQGAPVALVTGANSGIGRAAAILLAEHGYIVMLVARRETELKNVAEVIQRAHGADRAAVISADLADLDATREIISEIKRKFGRLDALINNAGIGESATIEQTSRQLLERTFAINTFAPALLTAEAWRLFQSQPALQDAASPCVINVSTMGTRDPFPGLFVYAASKIALESMARSIRNEPSEVEVRAYAVAPGAVETPLLRAVFSHEAIPPDRTLDPTAIARVIVDCVLGRRREESGATIVVPSP